MTNWKETLSNMGFKEEDLHPATIQEIKKTAKICERAGGVLRSRQVIASIIAHNEPDLFLGEKK